MARMMPIDEKEIKKAGYTYNSSLNPTCIPGRYNHLDKPRTWFYKDDVLQLPASVSPVFRFPLFWLAYHNLPAKVYRWLFQRTLKHDGYIVTYFHPWEFTNLKKWNLPFIITNHSGEGMIKRLDDLISFSIKKDYTFMTFSSFQQNEVPYHRECLFEFVATLHRKSELLTIQNKVGLDSEYPILYYQLRLHRY